jgi:hypothetical protein
LTAAFLVDLLWASLGFKETLLFADFRSGVLLATALFAFAREGFGVGARRFAADFGAARRAVARDVERLKLLVTALISKVMIERAMWTKRSGSCRGRVT